jgi:hypothetical protein
MGIQAKILMETARRLHCTNSEAVRFGLPPKANYVDLCPAMNSLLDCVGASGKRKYLKATRSSSLARWGRLGINVP